MVDPVEAKRLAAKQMEKIKAKEKFKVRIDLFKFRINYPHQWCIAHRLV